MKAALPSGRKTTRWIIIVVVCLCVVEILAIVALVLLIDVFLDNSRFIGQPENFSLVSL